MLNNIETNVIKICNKVVSKVNGKDAVVRLAKNMALEVSNS